MDDLINRRKAIDALCKAGCASGHCGISCDDVKAIEALPSAQPLTEEDYTELHDRFGTWVEEVVRDMISGEGKRWERG